MLQLTSDERRALRARAHGLNPVVSISQNGLSEGVLKEIDASLTSHELIKIRVYGDDRDVREGYLTEICEKLEAGAVQHIGKLLVVFRPSAELAAKKPPQRARRVPRLRPAGPNAVSREATAKSETAWRQLQRASLPLAAPGPQDCKHCEQTLNKI